MTEATVKCPICDSYSGELWGLEYRGRRIVKCRTCGLRYSDPQSVIADEVYDDNYFADKANRMFDPEKFLLVLKSDADSFARIASVMKEKLSGEVSLLDIGTGRGSFLILCKLLGFKNLMGTDITESNRSFLRDFGIEIKIGDLKDLELGKYDIVTFHHVLEHLEDPADFLFRLRSIIDDNGVGHLLVPNEGSLNSRVKSIMSRYKLKKRVYKHLSPGHHLWFFEKRTLIRLIEKSGYRIEYIGTRATEKKRGIMSRLVHRVFDYFMINSWLEIVFSKK
jgi:2-polyprenyl-3-methyl-5-hydroxy-6-metoxy-1,4-benzoquinol methylase